MSVPSAPLAVRRSTGRPRCQLARAAILEATVRLLERLPLQNLAIECIAREAGVGKATIYRWWPNKAAIVIDAFFEQVARQTEYDDRLSATDAIRLQVARVVKIMSGPQGRVVAQIIAEGQSDPRVLEHFRAVFLRGRRELARALVRRGIVRGEFSPDLDVEAAIDMIYGSVWYRLMVGHQPLDDQFAEALPRLCVALLANRPA